MEYVGGGRWRGVGEGGHRVNYIGGEWWRIESEDRGEEEGDEARRYYIKSDVDEILRRGKQRD